MNPSPGRHATLSVFMCNYNHAEFITQAIEAVISQSRPPDEFIIVDDGSTDNSVQIIESYAARNASIRFARNEKNLGIMPTMMRAMAMATGDYVFWTSADDYLGAGFVEKAMRMAEKYPEAGIIAGGWTAVDRFGRELWHNEVAEWKEEAFVSPQDYLSQYLMKYDALHTSSLSTVYKREGLLEAGGFRSELGLYCDTFALRAVALKLGCAYIPGRFAYWRTLEGSFSHALARQPRVKFDILARCVWLMRNSALKDRFDEGYIRKWERDFLNWIIDGGKKGLISKYFEAEEYFWQNVEAKSVLDRVLAGATFRIMMMNKKVTSLSFAHFLAKRTGDASCYSTKK